ncbi:apolipoprotein D-like [Littorina saxatilis]|uniref:apolipoprotein D-like n=1 Tax=Littorina saxatilis TaxID=31220 RepID=UPI0038B4F8C9
MFISDKSDLVTFECRLHFKHSNLLDQKDYYRQNKNMYSFILQTVVCISVLHTAQGACKAPPPSANFTMKGYSGMWYEVGKVQTAGGAYFEKDCVCTTIDVQPIAASTTGDATAVNSCRKLSPTGQFLNATGSLTEQVTPGKWKEGLFVFVPKVDYTVIYLDDEFAIEYDCSTFLGLLTNYCIHIMARHPTANQTRVQQLLTFAEGQLGLNTDNLPFQPTKQDGCW